MRHLHGCEGGFSAAHRVCGTLLPIAEHLARLEHPPAAAAKRGRRRTDDGLPVMGFRDVLRQLATLTLNTVALPLRGDRTFNLTAHPTALQQKAFDLLGIPPPCVQ